MPRRRYASNAERQRAYRRRLKCACFDTRDAGLDDLELDFSKIPKTFLQPPGLDEIELDFSKVDLSGFSR